MLKINVADTTLRQGGTLKIIGGQKQVEVVIGDKRVGIDSRDPRLARLIDGITTGIRMECNRVHLGIDASPDKPDKLKTAAEILGQINYGPAPIDSEDKARYLQARSLEVRCGQVSVPVKNPNHLLVDRLVLMAMRCTPYTRHCFHKSPK